MTDVIPIDEAPGGAADAFDGTETFPLIQDGAGKFGTLDQVKAYTGGGLTTLIADDEDVTVPAAAGTTIVLYTALTAPRVVTLPPASGPAQIVIVKDQNNQATVDNTITFAPDGTDTVHAFGSPNLSQLGYGIAAAVANDGVSDWTDITTSPGLNEVLGGLNDSAISQAVTNKYAFWTWNGEILGTTQDHIIDTWLAGDDLITKDQFKGCVAFDGPHVFRLPVVSEKFFVRCVIFTDDTCDETNTLTITGDTDVTVVGGDCVMRSAGFVEVIGCGTFDPITTWWIINRHAHDGPDGLFLRDLPTSDPHVNDALYDTGDGVLRRSHG